MCEEGKVRVVNSEPVAPNLHGADRFIFVGHFKK